AVTEAEAFEALRTHAFDGMVLDWAVSDLGGISFIASVQEFFADAVPAIAILGSPRIDPARVADLHRLMRRSSVRYAPSLERLLNDIVLLLHRSEENLADHQKETLAQIRQTDIALAGRKVLVIDDDLRNIFALTSVLEQADMTVVHAENGASGIQVLQ